MRTQPTLNGNLSPSLASPEGIQEIASVLDAALEYLRLSLSVIPLGEHDSAEEDSEKRPPRGFSWKAYQNRLASEAEARRWWGNSNGWGLAIVTGKLSGVLVLDVDGPKGRETIANGNLDVPLTPTVETGRGEHLYFSYPPGIDIKNFAGKLPGLDLRGEGGYAKAPPSLHGSGKPYRWVYPLGKVPLADAPAWLLDLCQREDGGAEGMGPRLNPASTLQAISEGMRNETLFREAARLRSLNLRKEEAEIIILDIAGRCLPAFPKREALTVVASAYRYPPGAKVLPDQGHGSTFPREAIRGIAGRFADLYSQYLEAPWSFWASNFLTCLGNVIADRVTLESAIHPQPRLYTVLLGESADERKSESQRQTLALFSEGLPEDFHPCLGVGSAEGLAERLKEHPKTLLVFDEFKSFVAKAGLDGSVLLPCANTLFDGNSYHSQTKSHSIEIKAGHLSIIAASTVETYSRMWTPAFTDIGFLNRLWLVPDKAERRFATPKPIPDAERERIKKDLAFLVDSLRSPIVLRMSSEANACFDEWYANLPRSLFSKRLDTYGHRLMILFAIQEGQQEVTGDITERVVSLLNWQLQVRRECDPLDAENKIASMEQAIRRALMRGPLTQRDLQKAVHYERAGIFTWNHAVGNLKEAREVFFDPKRKVFVLCSRE